MTGDQPTGDRAPGDDIPPTSERGDLPVPRGAEAPNDAARDQVSEARSGIEEGAVPIPASARREEAPVASEAEAKFDFEAEKANVEAEYKRKWQEVLALRKEIFGDDPKSYLARLKTSMEGISANNVQLIREIELAKTLDKKGTEINEKRAAAIAELEARRDENFKKRIEKI